MAKVKLGEAYFNLEIKGLDVIDRQVKSKFAEMGNSMGKLNGYLQRNQAMFEKIGLAGSVALGAIGVGISKSIKLAGDLGESINAVNVVFGESAQKIKDFSKIAADEVGLSKRAFNQLVTPIGSLLDNMGIKDFSEQTVELTKRASDMASVFNKDVSQALEAIASGLRGEGNPLEQFGVTMNDATIKAYALSKGMIKSGQEMTDQQKIVARLGVIFKDTEKFAGDFKNTSDSLANSQRILNAHIEDGSATIGTLFIPVIEQLNKALLPIVKNISGRIEKNPELTRIIIVATAGLAGLAVAVGAVGLALPAVIAGFGALTGTVGLVSLALVGVIAAFIVFHDDIKRRSKKISDLFYYYFYSFSDIIKSANIGGALLQSFGPIGAIIAQVDKLGSMLNAVFGQSYSLNLQGIAADTIQRRNISNTTNITTNNISNSTSPGRITGRVTVDQQDIFGKAMGTLNIFAG